MSYIGTYNDHQNSNGEYTNANINLNSFAVGTFNITAESDSRAIELAKLKTKEINKALCSVYYITGHAPSFNIKTVYRHGK